MKLPVALLAISFLIGLSAGHGYVQQLKVGNEYIPTWNPYKDPQKNIERITRKFKDNGPVTDGEYTVSSSCLSTPRQVFPLRLCLQVIGAQYYLQHRRQYTIQPYHSSTSRLRGHIPVDRVGI